ncbi:MULTISPECIES: GntR family transcriptional regulator [Allobaculum]|uniref:GntR family transcriptional regulator n=1 Tax=Allobaculum TaxID=174708 RepID=UPI001E541F15|nr:MULTISPECIES: GntR family transcriptional regulator [Allobaculum]UNT93080.1 GntR family transcriptional regulator [Allobaculum sp. Allo2]
MELEIVLSFRGDVPIYEQIETQMRSQILSGKLNPGQSVPSMRALAKMLKVSVITVQKAYEDLKQEGLIESAVGRGTVVAQIDSQAAQEARQKEVEACAEALIKKAKETQMTLEELLNLVSLLYEEDEV